MSALKQVITEWLGKQFHTNILSLFTKFVLSLSLDPSGIYLHRSSPVDKVQER